MNYLSKLFNRWIQAPDEAFKERVEAYLAQASDLSDLERRMRDLEENTAYHPSIQGSGLSESSCCAASF